MKIFRRLISIILLMVFTVGLNAGNKAYAATYGAQPAPEKLMVKSTNPLQPAIGYNKLEGGSTGYYADIGWDTPLKDPNPAPTGGFSQFVNIYLQEITKGYKNPKPTFLKDTNVAEADTPRRLKDLSSGTIYYASSKAYYTYNDASSSGVFTSGESASSNIVKLMTDIDITAYSVGVNQIKIVWDDVWDIGRRINYRLYISDNPNFASAMPIYIGPEQISQNGPVTVNESTGKLEYVYTEVEPSKVYYVKIVPDISDPDLVYTPESKTVPVSSFILVRTTKISETDAGTIWQLDWSPVVTGLDNSGISITYQIDKYVNDVPIPMLLESSTTTFITIPPGGEAIYYKIRANVTKNGVPLYPSSVSIVSDKIVVKDQEVSATPPAPELVDQFNDSYGAKIISYQDNLTATSATLLWRAPRKADGSVDTDTMYDIWMITNPNNIDTPPVNEKIASDLKMPQSSYVMNGTTLLGYKYRISNLTPNSTYYFKIVAKKTYVEFQNNKLINVEYASQPALKIIITPTQGPIDQPLVPARPPLSVKKKADGVTNEISDTDVTIQLKNKWYEHFDGTNWVYIDTTNINRALADPVAEANRIALKTILMKLENGTPDITTKDYRIVKYDSGVTLDVGCAVFTEGMTLSEINNIPANRIIGYSVTANDPGEDRSSSLESPQKAYKINIPVTGLTPNTTYIIWVRATRQSANLTSGPSDPIIVTTNPTDINQVEKPIVPVINYTYAGDNYVDLGWTLKTGYTYYIKYGLSDDINKATGSATVTTKKMQDAGESYYRLKGLNPNTLYYVWIQAEATNGTLSSKSDWSDSYPIKTKPDIPPNTPRGFGVKSPQDENVTKNSITFEWIKEDGMQYVIEIAGGVDYKDVKQYSAGNASELKIDGLRSNFRYFARLYAYDPTKQLKSEPTQSITVRTKRSSDDYDADQDVENVISGDYIIKGSSVIKGVWTISIIGVNADRFINHVQTDNRLDYKIDATRPPSVATKISVMISNKVFKALNGLGENLIIVSANGQMVIRPQMLVDELVSSSAKRSGEFNYEISITSPGTAVKAEGDNLNFKTQVLDVGVNAYDGSNPISIGTLNNPLKVVIPYDDPNWFKEGVTSAYLYDTTSDKWTKTPTQNSFDADFSKGYLSFETLKPGSMAIADVGKDFYNDTKGTEFEDSIAKIASVHDLKSVKGRGFQPDKYVSLGDAVKLVFDVMDKGYGSDYMSMAAKSGLIPVSDASSPGNILTREKAAAIIVRLYELKAGNTARPQSSISNYSDYSSINPGLLSRVTFAVENGLIDGRDANNFGPRDYITRGEFADMLARVLTLAGELD